MKTLLFFATLFTIFSSSLAQTKYCEERKIEYYEGTLFVYITKNLFDFPLETYAAYVSYKNNGAVMKMDSLVINQFRPGTEIIESEKVVKYDPAALKEAGLSKKPAMSFSKEMISLFKKYGVYYISRGVRSFSPQDTLPHYKTTKRKGRFLTQRTNYNKSLTIKFTEKSSTEKFAKLLSRLKGVRRVGLNEKVMEFFVPNDPDYINESGGIDQQKYMGSEVMNFEGAWDFIRGDAQPNIPITIAVIDTDFDNLFWVEDLKGNMNTNSPDFSGGSGSGHGIAVASVACAATNNESLIAGGGATMLSEVLTLSLGILNPNMRLQPSGLN